MAPRFEEGRVPPPQHSEVQERVLGCRHRVRIHRSQWPPREQRGNEDRPTVKAQCLKCGAQVLAEMPVPRNLDVVLYGAKGEEAGRVIEEAGQVLDESEIPPEPTSGTVSEEESAPRAAARGRIRS